MTRISLGVVQTLTCPCALIRTEFFELWVECFAQSVNGHGSRGPRYARLLLGGGSWKRRRRVFPKWLMPERLHRRPVAQLLDMEWYPLSKNNAVTVDEAKTIWDKRTLCLYRVEERSHRKGRS
jgi:hypothetical protein